MVLTYKNDCIRETTYPSKASCFFQLHHIAFCILFYWTQLNFYPKSSFTFLGFPLDSLRTETSLTPFSQRQLLSICYPMDMQWWVRHSVSALTFQIQCLKQNQLTGSSWNQRWKNSQWRGLLCSYFLKKENHHSIWLRSLVTTLRK